MYSVKLKISLSEVAVRLIRDSYRSQVNIRIKLGKSTTLGCLPERKHGISKLIGEDIDQQV